MKNLKEKLLQKLIDSTKSVKNKRVAEYQLHRVCETVLTVITVLAVISVISFTGWLFWLSIVLWGLMLYGWNALSGAAMTMLLNVLYPQDFDIKETEENQLNQLFSNIDLLIKELNED